MTAGLAILAGLTIPVPSPSVGPVAVHAAPPEDLAGPGSPPAIVVQPDAVIYEEDVPSFVSRTGSQLTLDGRPFRFTGLNIFNASNLDPTSCWYPWGSGDALDTSLTTIGPGQTVFRTWFFQRMATTQTGARDWSGFEHTLAVAQAHDERVIVTLGNQWIDCEGVGAFFKTEPWYTTGYRQPAPGLPESYRDWVAEVVARYRDRGTILAWQLMNEPSDQISVTGGCSPTAGATMHAFAADMAGLVKGLDPAHLVAVGTVGGGECGTAGADYQTVHGVTGIDLCEFHDYSPASPAMPQHLDLLRQRIAQCQAIGKPLIVGEAGITVKDAGSLTVRAQLFRTRFNAWFQAGVSGVLIWDWREPDESQGDSWQLGPGDPALAVLGGV